MKKSTSNYDLMRDQMEHKFAEHDVSGKIEKFHLKQDDEYIYITFVSRLYRIHKATGRVEGTHSGNFDDAYHASYNEAMTIFDILVYSDNNCTLAGTFNSIYRMKGVAQVSGSQDISQYQSYIACFDQHKTELKTALESLGGKHYPVGDIACQLPLFDFLPMILQFWESDDEFDAVLKVLWDENILNYMHFETTFFALTFLLDRIKEIIESPQ